jgi:BASS family bile acid:Na+ symporter
MTLATLSSMALTTSIFLLVLHIGLKATPHEAMHLLGHPGLLMRSLAAMYLVMPALAVAVTLAFDLPPAVEIALVALAVSPVPPFLPNRVAKMGGDRDYTISLLVVASVLALVCIPLAVEMLERIFARPFATPVAAVAKLVTSTVLAPLAAGMALRRFAPAIADRIAEPAATASVVLLAATVLPALVTAWKPISSLIGDGTIVAFVAFVAAGLGAGHLLGGPRLEERSVLALASGGRHPGIALALAHTNFPEDGHVLPAVLLYLIVAAVVAVPYLHLIRGSASQPGASP